MADQAPTKTTKGQDVLAEKLAPILMDIWSRRQPIEEAWLLYHHAHRGKNTRSFFKSDIFQHYLPAMRRSVEKFVTRGAQMLVPSSDFFEVYPAAEDIPEMDERAAEVKSYHEHIFNNRIKVYPFVKQLLRTWCLYGRAIAKTGVEVVTTKSRQIQGGDYLRDADGNRSMVERQEVWPTARPVDPFMFYIWPETVSNIESAQIVCEDVFMPYAKYKRLSDQMPKLIKPIDQKDLTEPQWRDSVVRRLSKSNMTTPDGIATPKDGLDADKPPAPAKQLVGYVHLTECWYNLADGWKMCWIGWNVHGGPLTLRYEGQPVPRPTYRMATARELPGEQYTTGMGDDLEPMQVLLNDQINMFLEGQAMQFSPPAVVDPDMVSRQNTIKMRPRAIWLANPKGVTWLKPDDTTKPGLQGIQFTMSMMDSFSGSSPMAEGQTTRNMPRAGFALSSMLNLSLADIKDAAMMIEEMILTPMLADIYNIAVDFTPEDQLIRIPGTNGLLPHRLQIKNLYGEWAFRWVGSIQSQDTQVRANRLVATLGVLAKLAPMMGQQLMVEGKKIDWEYIWRRVWRDALGERGTGSVIRKLTPEEMAAFQQQMMLQMMMMQQEEGQSTNGKPAKKKSGGSNGGRSPAPARNGADVGNQAVAGDVAPMSMPGMM